MRSLGNIGRLALCLYMGISFASCGDDLELWGSTKIGDKTYTFSEERSTDGKVGGINKLEVVPFDSTWGEFYYDGNNDHRINSPYDYAVLFDPRTQMVTKWVEYPNPELYHFDSTYVLREGVLKDTLAARREKF